MFRKHILLSTVWIFTLVISAFGFTPPEVRLVYDGDVKNYIFRGVVLDENLIVSVAHGIPRNAQINRLVISVDGRGYHIRRALVHREYDLSVLEPAEPFPAPGKTKVSTEFCTTGNCSRIYVWFKGGWRLFLRRINPTMYTINYPPVQGDSGSGVYNQKGHLVGIVSATDYRNGYIVHPTCIIDILNQFRISFRLPDRGHNPPSGGGYQWIVPPQPKPKPKPQPPKENPQPSPTPPPKNPSPAPQPPKKNPDPPDSGNNKPPAPPKGDTKPKLPPELKDAAKDLAFWLLIWGLGYAAAGAGAVGVPLLVVRQLLIMYRRRKANRVDPRELLNLLKDLKKDQGHLKDLLGRFKKDKGDDNPPPPPDNPPPTPPGSSPSGNPAANPPEQPQTNLPDGSTTVDMTRKPPFEVQQSSGAQQSQNVSYVSQPPQPQKEVIVERKPFPAPPDKTILEILEKEMMDITKEYGIQANEYFELLKARLKQHLNLPVI